MVKNSAQDVWHYAEEYKGYLTELSEASKQGKEAVMACLKKGVVSVDRSSEKLKRFMITGAADEIAKHVPDPHSICDIISDLLVNHVTPRYVRLCLEDKYKRLDKSRFAKMQGIGKARPEQKDSAEILPLKFDRGQAPPPKPRTPIVPLSLGKPTAISGVTYLETAPTLTHIPLPFHHNVSSGNLGSNSVVTLRIASGVTRSGADRSASWQNMSGQTVAVIVACIPNTDAAKMGKLESSISGCSIVRHSGDYLNYIVATT